MVLISWKRNDLFVFQALSFFGGARFEIFVSRLVLAQKITLRKDALNFVVKIIQYGT